MSLGGPEIVGIIVIVLLLFGAKKLPELAGSMGKSIKEFRKASAEADAEGATSEEAPRDPSRDASRDASTS